MSYDPDDITRRFFASIDYMKQPTIDRLLAEGVPTRAFYRPDLFGPATVCVDGKRIAFADELREPSESAQSFLFMVRDETDTVHDLIFWEPKADLLLPWLGNAWALGEAELGWPSRRADGVPVYRNAIEWLRNGRDGLVIIDAATARRRLLEDGPFIAAGGPQHGRELRKVLTPRAPEILIPISQNIRSAA